MQFVRKKKHGQNQKVRRTWFSAAGYRIVWRREVYGVRVPARFQACVRVLVPYSDGTLHQMWDFVNRNRRLMKTLKAAEEECERHERLWSKACEATGIRALRDLFDGKLPLGLPLWARKKMDRRLYAIVAETRPDKYRTDDEEEELCTESSSRPSDAPGHGGPTRTSDYSALPTEATTESPTPASPAEGKAKSTTRRTRHVRSRATSTSDASTVPIAEGAAKAQKKPAAKRTRKPSTHIAKRKTNTTSSFASGAKRSRGSRKTKLLPSTS